LTTIECEESNEDWSISYDLKLVIIDEKIEKIKNLLKEEFFIKYRIYLVN